MASNAQRLHQKVAVVTGGCSGMGRATTELFLAEGARVIVADIQADKGRALEEEFGANLRFVQCDVSCESDVIAAVGAAEKSFGGLDIIFNNAGAPCTHATIEDMEAAEWDQAMALLVRGVMFGIKHAIRAMKSRGGGSIINTSSLAGISPGLAVSAYAVAKAAVVQLGKYAAAEAAPHGIRINTLCPGFIATPVFGNLVHADRALADKMVRYYQDEFAQFQPLPKSGLPIDIAKAALFLASDDSAFITGTEFVVDGGALIQSRVKLGPAATASLYQVLERAKAKALAES